MAANDTANIRMTADDREALAMWQRQFQAVERLSQKLDRLGQAGATSGKNMANSFMRAGLQLGALSKGLDLAISGLRNMAVAEREHQQKKAETAIGRDEVFREFRGMGGLKEDAVAAPFKALFEQLAVENKNTFEWVTKAATQLQSSGFELSEVAAGVKALTEMATATGAKKTDPAEMAKNLALFMSASGQAMTGENLKANTRLIEQMKRVGNLEPEDLQFLAQEAAVPTAAGISPQDQLRMFTSLLFAGGSRVEASSLRVMVQRLASSSKDEERTRALGKMGLKPGDVDFVAPDGEKAEDWIEILDRLNKGLAKVPAPERAAVKESLFGAEGMRAADVLLQPAKVKEILGWRQDAGEPAFQESLNIRKAGPAAAMAEAEERLQQTLDKPRAAMVEVFRKQFENALKEQVEGGRMGPAQATGILDAFDFLKSRMDAGPAAQWAERFGAREMGDVLTTPAAQRAMARTPDYFPIERLTPSERGLTERSVDPQEQQRLAQIARLRETYSKGGSRDEMGKIAQQLRTLDREQILAETKRATDGVLQNRFTRGAPFLDRPDDNFSREQRRFRDAALEAQRELDRREADKLPDQVLQNRLSRGERLLLNPPPGMNDEQRTFRRQAEAAREVLQDRVTPQAASKATAAPPVVIENKEVAAAIVAQTQLFAALPGLIAAAVSSAVKGNVPNPPTPGRKPLAGLT